MQFWRLSWDFFCVIIASARSFQECKQKHRHDKMNNNIKAYVSTRTHFQLHLQLEKVEEEEEEERK
jgi:hypothetical protein